MTGRRVGDVDLGPIGLGCARLTMTPWAVSERQAIATIHAALDAGVTYLDTANCYTDTYRSAGANEALVATALRSWSGSRHDVLVGTKGGRWRPADGSWVDDARPEALRKACDASLAALDVEAIGLYHLHAPDSAVPLAESIGALAELQAAGKIRHVGVSNVAADELAKADEVAAIAAVQNHLSFCRHEPEDLAVANQVAATGRPFLAWGPLRGLEDDEAARAEQPDLFAVAQATSATFRQVALAYCRALAPTVVPVAGPTSPAQVAELVAGAELELPPGALLDD